MIPLNIRQSEPMSVALATHQPVLLYTEDCQQWGSPREELQLVSKAHRLKWRWEPGLKKREGTNRHIFPDLRNMTIAYIRMLAGVWHSGGNWFSQALCPLITCWAVTWKVLILYVAREQGAAEWKWQVSKIQFRRSSRSLSPFTLETAKEQPSLW